MKGILLLTLFVGLVTSDTKPGYQYGISATSYDAPVGSIGNLNDNGAFYHVEKQFLPNNHFVVTTPASILRTPVEEFSNSFNGGGSVFLNSFPTEASFLQSTPTYNLLNNFDNTVTVTEHPVIIPKLGPSQDDSDPQKVQRHLYFFSAPEEPEEVKLRVNIPTVPAKKNVKILFIKAPSFATQPLRIPAQVPNNEKTVVYVLVKKPEEQAVVVEQPPPTPPTKPEVFFIKYKTHKEAQEAISNIQSGEGSGSVSADSVENDKTFLNRLAPESGSVKVQDDFSQFVDVAAGLPSLGLLGNNNNFIAQTVTNSPFTFSSTVGPLNFPVSTSVDSLNLPVSTTASSIDFSPSTTASPFDFSVSTTASPLDVSFSTTPSAYNLPISFGNSYQQNNGVHSVYGPPLKR